MARRSKQLDRHLPWRPTAYKHRAAYLQFNAVTYDEGVIVLIIARTIVRMGTQKADNSSPAICGDIRPVYFSTSFYLADILHYLFVRVAKA